ncbi:hypothetical protein LX36DRAFT_716927, partial [Colletotrichum falcatum]
MIVPRFDTIFTVGAALSASVALAAPAVQPALDARDLAENEAGGRRANLDEIANEAFIERRDNADDDEWRRYRRRRRYGEVADDGKKKDFSEGWLRGGNPREDFDFIERRDDADDEWRRYRRRRRYGYGDADADEVDDGKKKSDFDDGKKKDDVDDGKKKKEARSEDGKKKKDDVDDGKKKKDDVDDGKKKKEA